MTKPVVNDNMDDVEFLAEMREDFLEGTPAELESCEGCLMSYEKTKDEAQMVEFKRFVHSIKGGARCVGLNDFSDYLHVLETKLQKATQENRMKEFINLCLPFIDQLRGYVEALADGGAIDAHAKKLKDSLAKFV